MDNTKDTKTINWKDMERTYEKSIVPECSLSRTLTQLNKKLQDRLWNSCSEQDKYGA